MQDLNKLPNIGPTLAGKLNEVGITSFEELEKMGSVAVVLQIKDVDLSACYNMLYAIEGAIRGIRWHAIPKNERDRLKEKFDQIVIS